jgi:hypothetical protein
MILAQQPSQQRDPPVMNRVAGDSLWLQEADCRVGATAGAGGVLPVIKCEVGIHVGVTGGWEWIQVEMGIGG